MFSDIKVIEGKRAQSGSNKLTGECPKGYQVLFSKEWPGFAKACNCVTESMISERTNLEGFS